KLRGPAGAATADPRLHRRISLLQSSVDAVPGLPTVAFIGLLGTDRATDSLRACRSIHQGNPHHLHGPDTRTIEDLSTGDLPSHAHRGPARREAQLSRRRAIQAVVLLAIGLLILYGVIRTVHPAEVGSAIRGASVGWILLAEVAYLAIIAVRRCRRLVTLRATAPQRGLAHAMAVAGHGFALHALWPLTLGDLLRIVHTAPERG